MDNRAETTSLDCTRALWGGIAFSLGFVLLIWAAGAFWLSPDRQESFAATGQDFFMPRMWYLWQLGEPNFWTRATAWGGYIAHYLAIWYLIWKAQHSNLSYSGSLHRVNVLALGANALFITLHLVQTLFWYDGLAQDVSEFTSQASVTLVLVGILILENPRRGLVLGYRAPFPARVTRAVRKYHGYYFAWAIIYTFWYHPMEITGGHLLGFLYMFFLLLQGSLFFTRVHVNPYWTVVSEVSVVGHAIMVAVLAGQQWQHFFGGFLGMFVITQMHGLGLSRAARWAIGLAYIAAVLFIYSVGPGIASSYMVTLIPLVEFVLVLIVSLLVLVLAWALGGRRANPAA